MPDRACATGVPHRGESSWYVSMQIGDEMTMRFRALAMVCFVLVLIVTITPAVAGDADRDDQVVGVTVRTPGVLAIGVESDVDLGISAPGTTTAEVGFHVGIVNDTDEGWEVHVTATDFEGFTRECDDAGKNCVQKPSDPVHTIAASNLHIRGGAGGGEAVASVMAAGEGSFEAAGIPFRLLTGPGTAVGTLGVDDPQTIMWLNVPSSTPDGEYAATLTYTITASTP